ncbi:sigma 54-interacting transcriptional regulator [candidate division KSB1 bacterium]|nr:sigma 54-interacting transcriptional regulator [candidate division KSB1 bacterium]
MNNIEPAQHVYKKIFELCKGLVGEADVESLLPSAMDGLVALAQAERGMIILFDQKGEIIFETARNLEKNDLDHPRFEISRTIIERVCSSGSPLFFPNALREKSLSESDSVHRLKILSVICLPLIHDQTVFGVIYLDNRTVKGIFTRETCDLIAEFADFVSLTAYGTLQYRRMQSQVEKMEAALRARYDFTAIVGHSQTMVEILHLISQVADTDAVVLLEGETGTGKELVARAIHDNSRRRDKPFICINCGAIPENLLESELFGFEKGAFTGAHKRHRGTFEQADGGTLFLDEVEEMSPALQVKLLRVLQWGEVTPLASEKSVTCDVRIIAASKAVLRDMVDKGAFRDDLYYRLNLVSIRIPPLRERQNDIPALADYFLKKAAGLYGKKEMDLSAQARSALAQYNYPGNIRELENIIERAVILCEGNHIEAAHLPAELSGSDGGTDHDAVSSLSFAEAKKIHMAEFERDYLLRILDECKGVIKTAARRAGMHEKNLHEKLKKYGIRPRR